MNQTIILKRVDGYGWLPIVEIEGKEKYRGEFHQTPEEASERAIDMLKALVAQEVELSDSLFRADRINTVLRRVS